jgi:hypothetical protein
MPRESALQLRFHSERDGHLTEAHARPFALMETPMLAPLILIVVWLTPRKLRNSMVSHD